MAQALADAGTVAFVVASLEARAPLTLVLNDAHRMTDSAGFLAALFELLDGQGVELREVRVLFAAGSHRADAAEKAAHERAVLGACRERIGEVAWHDAFDDAGLAVVGNVRMHRWMAEQGYYLACGSMEPHYFAGVTGAHKTLTVGVMDAESIRRNHEHAMSEAAMPLRLDGNPVHLGIVDALADLEDSGAHVLALNQVLVGGRLAAVTAGHPLGALSRGLDGVRSCFGAAVDAPFDLVVATVHPPLDRDFYQAEKGIKNTERVVRDGGTMVLDAACERGVGIDHFLALLREAPTFSAARKVVARDGYKLGDHKAVRLRALTEDREVRVIVVSPTLDPELAPILGVEIASSREEAANALRKDAPGNRALWVDDAGNVVPWMAERRPVS